MVADRNLMNAQLLAQALSKDSRFQVTVVAGAVQVMSAGAHADVGVINAELGSGVDEAMRMTRTFSERYPNVRLIILMDAPSREMVVDAFRCGASGVFSRSQPVDDFLKCVDRVSQGEIWASRSEIDHLLSALRGTPVSRMVGCEEISVLSKRELSVVRLAGEGLANKEIAEKLGLSEHTVKNYLFRAFEKIGVSSRVELLFYLLRQEKFSSAEEVAEGGALSKHHKAAVEGFAGAQFALGVAHRHGDGAEKSDTSAYYWFTLAERNAEQLLLQSRQILGELRKSMSVENIQEIERSLEIRKFHHTNSKSELNLLKRAKLAPPSSFAV
jgi:DNA-binding NarL/FixJ family response regulator